MFHALPFLSSILLILTFPPYEVSWLLYVALIPLFFYIDRSVELKKMLLVVGLAGFFYGVYTLFPLGSTNAWWWIGSSGIFFEYKELALYAFLGSLALVGNGALFAAFAYGFKQIFSKDSAVRNWLFRALLVAALWALIEYGRSYIPGGIVWQELGISAAPQAYIRQIAHLVGVYGLSFFIVLINTLLYQWFRSKTSICYPVTIFLLFVTAFLYGQYRIEHISSASTRSARVATIHSTLTTQEESVGLVGFRYYETAVLEALEQSPDIVVLPENAVSFLVIDEHTTLPLGYQLPASTLRTTFDTIVGWSLTHPNTAFLIGLHTKKDEAVFNSVVYIENGTIRGIYHKRHLLPIAEGSFATDKLASSSTPMLFQTRVGAISPSICSEILHQDIISRSASADLLSVSGNDAIFESPIVARRGRQVAILRAVESGKYIIVSTKGLESAVINPLGEVEYSSKGATYSVATIRF